MLFVAARHISHLFTLKNRHRRTLGYFERKNGHMAAKSGQLGVF